MIQRQSQLIREIAVRVIDEAAVPHLHHQVVWSFEGIQIIRKKTTYLYNPQIQIQFHTDLYQFNKKLFTVVVLLLFC